MERSISTWDEDHRAKLLRIRNYAVTTIAQHPFRETSSEVIKEPQKPEVTDTEPSSKRLCNACMEIVSVISKLVSEAQIAKKMGAHHIALNYTLSDLYRSASLGCHLCSIFEASTLNYIKNGKPSSLEFDDERVEESWLWLTTNPSRMEDLRCDLKLGLINQGVLNDSNNELSFFPPISSMVDGKKTPASLTSDTGNEATFDIISSWLQTCDKTHDRCKRVRPAEPNVPRRLLHLSETTVKVVEDTKQAQYICLSHCWGSQANVPNKLTHGGQYAPFEISSLPKTFRDAISITKRLGYEYIWIDCFCIIQGSREDWIEQSAVMAQIYANSVFTIAALAAKNTHGGCFVKRNPLALQPLHTKKVRVEPRIGGNLWRLEVEGLRLESSPLHTRGWVVQERLSAARTIFFGSLGVYWECRCMHASESHTEPISDVTENFKTMLPNLQAAAAEPTSTRLQEPHSDFLDRWQRLLEIYTVCALTYNSDKLIAISGIARDIEKYSGKRYLQGLWRHDLPSGLLWFHIYPSSGFTRKDLSGPVPDSGFPSWSWASMRGKIQYFGAPGEITWVPRIETEEGSRDSSLRITSWMREVTLNEDSYVVLVDDGSRRGDLDEDYNWFPDEKVPEQVPMSVVLIQRVMTSKKPFLGQVKCLVVTQVSGNVYRRVGAATIRFSTPRDDPFPLGDPQPGEHDVVLI